MPLNGWGAACPKWATTVENKGVVLDSSEESETLHVDWYLSSFVLFFE